MAAVLLGDGPAVWHIATSAEAAYRGMAMRLTLVYTQSRIATRVLPGGTVRSRRPPSPPGGLFRVGPGRAQPTVVRESSKVNWLNVCRPSDGHPRHPTWTTPPAGNPVLHMLVEQ